MAVSILIAEASPCKGSRFVDHDACFYSGEFGDDSGAILALVTYWMYKTILNLYDQLEQEKGMDYVHEFNVFLITYLQHKSNVFCQERIMRSWFCTVHV